MLDVAHYDREGRRALAEAQGWLIDWRRTSYWSHVRPSGQVARDEDLPDPLRDDGDAWRLLKFLGSAGVYVRFEPYLDGRRFCGLHDPSINNSTGGGTEFESDGANDNEALVGAALAWLAAKCEGAYNA